MSEEEVFNSISTEALIHLETSSAYKHVLTHQRIFATFYRFKVKDSSNFVKLQEAYGVGAFNRIEIEELPKPILIDNYWKEHFI